MALDIKQFAIIARATNSLFMYTTTDNIAAVTGSNYFKNKDLSGYVKKNDIILVVASDKVAFLRVSAVTPEDGTITVASVIAQGT